MTQIFRKSEKLEVISETEISSGCPNCLSPFSFSFSRLTFHLPFRPSSIALLHHLIYLLSSFFTSLFHHPSSLFPRPSSLSIVPRPSSISHHLKPLHHSPTYNPPLTTPNLQIKTARADPAPGLWSAAPDFRWYHLNYRRWIYIC